LLWHCENEHTLQNKQIGTLQFEIVPPGNDVCWGVGHASGVLGTAPAERPRLALAWILFESGNCPAPLMKWKT
jgi:hypothetical protein